MDTTLTAETAVWRTLLIQVWGRVYRLLPFGVLFAAVSLWYPALIWLRLAPAHSLFRQPGWLLAAFGMAVLTAAFLHEIGHVLSGKAARLRLHQLIIGPIQIINRTHAQAHETQWRVRWLGQHALWGGLTTSLPHDEHRLAQRLLLFALGGPAASLLTGVGMGAAAYAGLQNGRSQLSTLWIWEWGLLFAIASLGFGVSSLNPRPYANGIRTDGNRIALLLQGGAAAARWCALTQLYAANLRGLRPKEWPASLMQTALSLANHVPDTVAALMFAYQHALDQGKPGPAMAYLEEALQNRAAWERRVQQQLRLEKAFVSAWRQRRCADARYLLGERLQSQRHQDAIYYRLQAALALCAGDKEAALATAAAGCAVLEQLDKTGFHLAEAAWLQQIHDEASTP